jgi:hypothetical protein
MTTSCQDHSNLYDSDYASAKKQLEYAESFPVQNIDPTQDWNLFTTADVQVTVNEDWGETYTVKVYTANPLDETSGALLLAKGEVKSGETFSTKIDVAKAQNVVWVARVDSHNRRLVDVVSISNGVAKAYFGETSTRAGEGDYVTNVTQEAPYTNAEINEMIQGGKLLSEATSDDLYAGGVFYVPEGETFDLNSSYYADSDSATDDYRTKIVIAGTLNFGANASIGGNEIEIIVANNGTLNIPSGSKLNNSRGGRFVALYGSTITGQGEMTLCNGSKLNDYNAGTITLRYINNNGGTLYNAGIITSTNLVGSESTLINDGKIEVRGLGNKNLTIKNLVNNCYIECDSATITNATLAANTQLYCKEALLTGSGEWTLGDQTLVYVGDNGVGYYEQNNTSIAGPENGYASLILNTDNFNINYDGYPDIKKGYIINNVYVEISNQSAGSKVTELFNGGPWSSVKKGTGGTMLATIGESPYYNPEASSCAQVVSVPVDNGGDTDDDEYDYCYYAYEDLGSIGDFDFNDVVLRVSKTETEYQYKVEIVAAGGMLPVAVYFEGTELWDDIHGANGFNDSNVINVGAKKKSNYPTTYITSTKQEAFNQLSTLIISVSESNSTNLTLEPLTVNPITEMGAAPQCLIIPAGWGWPTEYTNLTWVHSVEGHSFAEWAQDKTKATDWYKYISEDYESYVITPAK